MMKERDGHPMEDPEGRLEWALIEEFLRARGVGVAALHTLSDEEVKHMLTEASVFAGAKLAEVEARAHFLREIHCREP